VAVAAVQARLAQQVPHLEMVELVLPHLLLVQALHMQVVVEQV
jgi:hypothetical protein